MDAADYWLMAREYSIWNAPIASLQFWTADLDPVTLGSATEQVYTTFFYSPSSHTLHQQSDKILFGCFVIALNAAFDQQLSLADEGYESGSNTFNLPTPLRKTPQIHHVSSMEHASFDPAPVPPRNTPQTPPRPVHRWLSSQFNRWQHSSQHSRMFRRWRRGRGLPDHTSKWWTLSFRGNTWKNIVHAWAWIMT